MVPLLPKLDNPVRDSPQTPTTPPSPSIISKSTRIPSPSSEIRAAPGKGREEPKTEGFKKCVWRIRQQNGIYKNVFAFKPSSSEEAKEFLRQPAFQLPVGVARLCDTPLSSQPGKQRRRQLVMICHGCHGHMGGGAHSGSAVGKSLCSFPHSATCQGGIVEDDTWKGCPTGYTFQGFDDTMYSVDFRTPVVHQSQAATTPLLTSVQNGVDNTNLPPGISTTTALATSGHSLPPTGLAAVSMMGSTQADTLVSTLSSVTTSVTTSSQSQVPRSDSSEDQLVYDFLRLSLQQMGEGAKSKTSNVQTTTTQNRPVMSHDIQAKVNALRAANQAVSGTNSAQDQMNIARLRADPTLQVMVGSQMQFLRGGIPALSSARSAPGLDTSQLPHNSGGIPVIQRNPNQYQDVTTQSFLPHQAFNQPNIVHNPVPFGLNTPGQPSQVLQGIQGQGVTHAPAYPTSQSVQDFLHQQQQQLLKLSQPHHSVTQQRQYKMEYRCSPTTGRTYQVAVPVVTLPSAPVKPQQVYYEWRCDPKTGATFQVPVQKSPDVGHQQLQPAQSVVYNSNQPQGARVQHYQPQQSILGQTPSPGVQQYQPQQSILGQAPSYVGQQPYTQVQSIPVPAPILDHNSPQGVQYIRPTKAQSPRQAHQAAWDPSLQLNQNLRQLYQQSAPLQGAYGQLVQQQVSADSQDRMKGIVPIVEGEATSSKGTRVIDFARKCPVKWAKSAKADSINLPLYSYGAVTEIEAALSGRGDPMQVEVMLAKIRHLKNVFEVCCLNSSPTNFSTYGWQIARDYAIKVEEEVEQRFVSWQDMVPGVRTQTLVLSQMEYPRQPLKTKATVTTDSKGVKKERCTTFNTCTTEGKCDYEVANPGRSCNRKHECSWCRSNLQQSYKHQASKCLKKQTADQ